MLLELVMIVKDSGPIIIDTLNAVKPYIDYWTILDTGSRDSTPENISTTLEGVPGKLWQEPFVDFLVSRNRSLDLASGKCKYLLILDDSYILRGGEQLREILSKIKTSVISITITDNKQTYPSNRIILTQSGKRYEKYRIHEGIFSDKTFHLPEDISILDEKPSIHINRTTSRLKSDLKILYQQLDEYPGDTRILYYLAKTYTSLDDKRRARKYYTALLEKKDAEEYQLFESSFFNIEYDYDNKIIDTETAKKRLLLLSRRFPKRVDALFKIFLIDYLDNRIDQAYQSISKLYQIPVPKNYNYSSIHHDLYIPYFYIDVNLKLYSQNRSIANLNLAVDTLRKALKQHPNDYRFLNIKDSISKPDIEHTLLSAEKTIVIHTGENLFSDNWSPIVHSQTISGSEIMAIGLAETFSKSGYRVFVFGQFGNTIIHNRVTYLDHSNFRVFCEKYYIDTLIISRYCDKLVYRDNIKNVYLWIHDVYPANLDYMFQTNPKYFRGLLCLSNWQRQKNIQEYKLDKSLVKVVHNAIDLSLYEVKVEREPYRFIWTSSASRGLELCVDMFSEISKRYPSSKLYIFANKEIISRNICLDNPGIIVRDRLPQRELATELAKSDVWLYPNHFEETYCISAVEAQAAGCLVCTNVHAGLIDTVADRGAVIKGKYNKEKLLEILFHTLENPNIKAEKIDKGKQFAKTQTFENLISLIL